MYDYVYKIILVFPDILLLVYHSYSMALTVSLLYKDITLAIPGGNQHDISIFYVSLV